MDSVNVIGLSNWETPEIYTNSLLKKAYFASLIDYTSTPFAKKYEEYYMKMDLGYMHYCMVMYMIVLVEQF